MYKTIIAPIDINSKGSWDLGISKAYALAKQFNAEIYFITVVPDYGLGMVQEYFPKGWLKETMDKSKIELNKILDNSLDNDITYHVKVLRGAVYQEIITFSEEVNGDLLVIAAHHPDRKDYLFGPNAAKVARHITNIDVLIVR